MGISETTKRNIIYNELYVNIIIYIIFALIVIYNVNYKNENYLVLKLDYTYVCNYGNQCIVYWYP